MGVAYKHANWNHKPVMLTSAARGSISDVKSNAEPLSGSGGGRYRSPIERFRSDGYPTHAEQSLSPATSFHNVPNSMQSITASKYARFTILGYRSTDDSSTPISSQSRTSLLWSSGLWRRLARLELQYTLTKHRRRKNREDALIENR